MKILVIDDNPSNRSMALEQLKEHEVTVAGTYDEGLELLDPYEKVRKFEMVLVDLLMPPSLQKQRTATKERFANQEMPVGVFLALRAAKIGVTYVGLLTNTNHHDHPGSACLDDVNAGKVKTQIEGSFVVMTNYSGFLEYVDGRYEKRWDKLFNFLVNNEFPSPT